MKQAKPPNQPTNQNGHNEQNKTTAVTKKKTKNTTTIEISGG